jgi:hypothetical protein
MMLPLAFNLMWTNRRVCTYRVQRLWQFLMVSYRFCLLSSSYIIPDSQFAVGAI